MVAGSNIAKLVALGLAVAVHGAVLLGLGPVGREAAEIEGASGAGEVRLGQGFADMAAGRLKAEAPVDAVRPEAPERAEAARAEVAEPVAGEAARAERAETVDADAGRPERAAPVEAEAALPAEAPARADDAPPAQERIAGATPESAAVEQSVRPRRRDPAREEARPAPARDPAPKGNAAHDNRAGTATGQAQAPATSRATQGEADAAGDAAASNYPGQVMRKLTRAGQPRVDARGEAVVGFTIADNGALAEAGIARSSGSDALDRAALGIVRGAAPFPRPPQGAQRRFSIRIRGR